MALSPSASTEQTKSSYPDKGKSGLKLGIKVFISLILLAYVLSSTGLEATFKKLSTANLYLIPVCVLIYLSGQLISAFRWKALAGCIGIQRSLREFYDYYLIGMYLSLFLPSTIGGDVGRMYYLAKSTGRKKRETLLTIMAERSSGLASLLILTSIACLSPDGSAVPLTIKYVIYALTLVGIVGFFTLQCVSIKPLARKFPKLALLVQAEVYWKNWGIILQTITISTVFHGFMVLVQWVISRALGLDIPVLYLLMTYGAVSLISIIPITFNGIGLREGAYQYLLTRSPGVTNDAALAFGLYWFVISTLTSLVGGLILFKGHYKTPDLDELPVEED